VPSIIITEKKIIPRRRGFLNLWDLGISEVELPLHSAVRLGDVDPRDCPIPMSSHEDFPWAETQLRMEVDDAPIVERIRRYPSLHGLEFQGSSFTGCGDAIDGAALFRQGDEGPLSRKIRDDLTSRVIIRHLDRLAIELPKDDCAYFIMSLAYEPTALLVLDEVADLDGHEGSLHHVP
jgi:hypothetical protein